MATRTVTLGPEILEAARLEAECRNTILDQVVADRVSTYVPRSGAGYEAKNWVGRSSVI
jgi:hypothetical protein